MTMFGAMIAVGTLSYDETDNRLAFLMTLPGDRKTYVREKYLFILIYTAAAWCIAAILYCIGERQTGSPSVGSASRYPPHSDCRQVSAISRRVLSVECPNHGRERVLIFRGLP